MSNKLAKTTYEAGPEDQLIVKDVYKETSSAVVNSYQDKVGDALNVVDMIPSLNLGSLMGKLNAAINFTKGKININAALNLAGAGRLGQLSGLAGLAGLPGLPGAAGLASLAGLPGLSRAGLGISGSIGNLGSFGLAGSFGANGAFGSFGEIRAVIGNIQASMGGISSVVGSINIGVSTSRGLEHAVLGQFGSAMGGDINAFINVAGQFITQNNSGNYNRFVRPQNDYDTRTGYMDVNSLAKNLSNGNLDIFSSIIDLPAEHGNQLNGGLTSNQITSNVVAGVGSTLRNINTQNGTQTVGPVANIVNALSANTYQPKIVNKGAAAALISAVTHIGNDLNMPDVFPSIANHVEDKSILLAAARPLVQRAVETGDMRTIESLAGTKIAGDMKTIAPSLITNMLGTINKPDTLAQQEYSKFYQGIRESFDKIDPNWSQYDRKGQECINASPIKDNLFMVDLIRSQMNELMHPDTYVANLQRVYSEDNFVDTATTQSLGNLINSTEAITSNTPVDLTNIVAVDYDYTETGNAVNPKSQTIVADVSGVKSSLSFDSEPFLLLAGQYLQDSVQECLQRDFPQWFNSFDTDSILVCDYH